MRRALVFLPLALFALLGALFAAGLLRTDRTTLPSTLIDRAAPSLALSPIPGIDRPGIDPSTLTVGGPAIVNFFASWCPPCHAEHPILMELSKERRIRLIGINQKDAADKAKRFLDEKGNPYNAIGVDPDGRAGIEWGVYGLPESYVVRADGTIAFKLVGPLTAGNITRFREEIDKALAGR